jgi:activating signal cointegrator complex subunit 2
MPHHCPFTPCDQPNTHAHTHTTHPSAQDTEHRGQLLVEQLMHCGSASAAPQPAGERSLLHALNAAFHMDAAVAEAVSSGLLALDDAQLDYLLALLGGDRRLLGSGSGSISRPAGTSASAGAGPSSSAAAAGPSAAAGGRDPAVLRSLVSQVKELLPEYGDGFIAACLHGCGYQAEAVINALLEGALPGSVQGLDPQLAAWAPPAAGGAKAAAAPQVRRWCCGAAAVLCCGGTLPTGHAVVSQVPPS